MEKNIVVLEGDGIGPEACAQMIGALNAVGVVFGHEFIIDKRDFGAGSWVKNGSVFPDETKNACDGADAILKGPVGDAKISKLIKDPRDSPEIGGILALRSRLTRSLTFGRYCFKRACTTSRR